MNLQQEMFAWVTSANGKNYIVGALLDGLHMPLVAASRETIERVRDVAIEHAKEMRQPVRLVRFQEVETLESYEAPAVM